MKKVNEVTRVDLINGASPEPWKQDMSTRSRPYTIFYLGVVLNEGSNTCEINFKTEAPGHTTCVQKINLDDFWFLYNSEVNKETNRLTLQDIVRLAIMDGDLHLYCSCPSWVYGGYQYMATQLDYAYFKKEHRYPKKRNPRLLGTVCKHLYVALKYLPNNSSYVVRDIKRKLQEPQDINGEEEN